MNTSLELYRKHRMTRLLSTASLELQGLTEQPLVWSVQELRHLAPLVQLGPTDIVCMTERLVSQAGSLAGVPLKAVLEHAGLSQWSRAERKQTLILCHGADGYRVIFSWYELFNTAVGDQVLLIVERDGQALAGREGDGQGIALISAADTFRGPRNMHGLVRIEVLRLP